MKRFSVLAALALMFGIVLVSAAVAQETTFRDLVRKYIKDGDGKQLGSMIGFTKPVQHVVALEYTVLTKIDGKEQPVDPTQHEFKVGEAIRVRIQPVSDTYIYIFHEGASGKRVCLLPTEQEKAPFVKAGQTIELPGDGFFEFTAPPGDEQLLVVATEKPTADLAGLSNVVFNKPDDQLTPQEKDIKKLLRAKVQQTLKSIRERQEQSTTYRELFNEEGLKKIAKSVQESGATRSVLEEPPTGKQPATFAMAASTKTDSHPSLFVKISLKSVNSKKSKT